MLFFTFFCSLGLLVDIFGDYKYLFLMCGGVITAGGVFLFIMNVYNYNRLDKAKKGNSSEQNQNNMEQNQNTIENQEQESSSEAQRELMDVAQSDPAGQEETS